MMRASRALSVALVLLSSTLAAPSLAQDREADAERLFREGQKLMEARRFGEACPKFEAAYRKDGQLGTLMNLAFCHKEQGSIWYAWLEFREAEVKATELSRTDRRDFARQRLAELDKLLPKVVVDNPRKVPIDAVLVEDKRVPEAERGAVFAVEEGRRKITFRAKGKKPATLLVDVARSDRAQHIAAPDLEDLPPDELAPPEVKAPGRLPSKPAPVGDADEPAGRGTTQRTLGWISIGVGGVAALVGGIAGVVTLASDDCKDQTVKPCTQQEYDAISSTATISTVSFIAAGVAVAGGIVLLATAPSRGDSVRASALVRPGTALPSAPQRAGAPERLRGRVSIAPRIGPAWAGVVGTFW